LKRLAASLVELRSLLGTTEFPSEVAKIHGMVVTVHWSDGLRQRPAPYGALDILPGLKAQDSC
jgi:hypothetical protein